MEQKRSPLRNKPLRQPGESLASQLQDIVIDKILSPTVLVPALWGLAIGEWARYLRQTDPQPLWYTILALIGTAVTGVFVRRQFKRARTLKLGLDGKKAVGEFLNRLHAKGCRVYHDVICDRGNIDHVIVSDRGVLTIETKTRSIPESMKPVVTFDGTALCFAGRLQDETPIAQARAQAANLRRILKEETGHDYPIRPVILIPGWFVKPLRGAKGSDVWVLNPKALPKWLDKERERLAPEARKSRGGKSGRLHTTVHSIGARAGAPCRAHRGWSGCEPAEAGTGPMPGS